jgi:hypothetical protein
MLGYKFEHISEMMIGISDDISEMDISRHRLKKLENSRSDILKALVCSAPATRNKKIHLPNQNRRVCMFRVAKRILCCITTQNSRRFDSDNAEFDRGPSESVAPKRSGSEGAASWSNLEVGAGAT